MEYRVFSTHVTDHILNKKRFTYKIRFFPPLNNERSLCFNWVYVSKTIVVICENDSLFVNIFLFTYFWTRITIEMKSQHLIRIEYAPININGLISLFINWVWYIFVWTFKLRIFKAIHKIICAINLAVECVCIFFLILVFQLNRGRNFVFETTRGRDWVILFS